jgi:hypothetical protein
MCILNSLFLFLFFIFCTYIDIDRYIVRVCVHSQQSLFIVALYSSSTSLQAFENSSHDVTAKQLWKTKLIRKTKLIKPTMLLPRATCFGKVTKLTKLN